MAALRINISDSLHLKEQKYGVINFLYSPLIFMLTYSVLRYFFLKIFGNEPIQAGFYQTSWEQGEYRKLHWGDIIFTILLILIPLGSVVLVGKL
ncbi:hypothetical protein GCM10027429_13390 [Marivirga atlantica]|uniref:Uncharacterized protein n=1 Tax=Marivirga atlantica TaxID=1548457 RepID=A0A937AJY8_9BACT|nr:hypothetical protein [Marivirga atlantica]MBL0764953.1 hypothetical protein [Marivirga atlantica]